jgi:hypothetical protein
VPDHQCVSRARHLKIQVPAKVLLTGFFISWQAQFSQFADQPHRNVVSEAARINEIVFRLSHVESCALERDNRFNFRVHRAAAILALSKGQCLINDANRKLTHYRWSGQLDFSGERAIVCLPGFCVFFQGEQMLRKSVVFSFVSLVLLLPSLGQGQKPASKTTVLKAARLFDGPIR